MLSEEARAVRSSGAGVVGGYELRGMGAGT